MRSLERTSRQCKAFSHVSQIFIICKYTLRGSLTGFNCLEEEEKGAENAYEDLKGVDIRKHQKKTPPNSGYITLKGEFMK